MVVSLESVSIAEGETLRFVATDPTPEGQRTELQITHIDVVATRWKATILLQPQTSSAGWIADHTPVGFDTEVLYQANIRVGDRQLETQPASLLFEIRSSARAPASEGELADRLTKLLRQQDEFYRKPLGDDSSGNEYTAVVTTKGVMLTTPMRVPGLVIRPFNPRKGPTWEGEILNAVLRSLGWPAGADLDDWGKRMLREHPTSAVIIERIRAASPQAAHELAIRHVEAVLDVLALKRGARGEVVGAAVQDRSNKRVALIHPHGPTYGGNLLGGFISGEDPHDFVAAVHAVETDSRVALHLRLYAEAEREQNLDSAYLRFWGLLELVALSEIPEGEAISLFDGTPILGEDRRPRTTSQTHPRVYDLVKRNLMAGNISETYGSVPNEDMWGATGVWYARRNASAHHGGLRPNDPLQVGASWYDRAMKSYDLAAAAGGQTRFHDPYFRWLQDTSKTVVDRELYGKPR